MGKAYSIKGKKIKESDLPELLTCVKDEAVVSFLKDHKILLPRITRISALKNVLKDILLAESANANKIIEADKNNVDINISKRADRLNWFEKFCETQLENELNNLNNPDLNKRYMIILWTNILEEFNKQNVEKELIEKFIENNQSQSQDEPNPLVFHNTLNHYFFDEVGSLDGLSIDQFKETILYSSSVKELDMIATKYDVKIPKNLKRDQVQEAIILELKKKGAYIEDDCKVLDTYTTKQLEDFAAANDLIASRYISKPQAIDYLLRNAQTTKDVFELEMISEPIDMPSDINNNDEEKVVEKPTVAEEIVEEVKEPNWTTKTQTSKVKKLNGFIKDVKNAEANENNKNLTSQNYDEDKLDLILRELQLNNRYLETLLKHKIPIKVKRFILLCIVIFIIFVVFTYFYKDVFLLGSIVNLLNQIPFFLNRGLMDFFYHIFEVLIS